MNLVTILTCWMAFVAITVDAKSLGSILTRGESVLVWVIIYMAVISLLLGIYLLISRTTQAIEDDQPSIKVVHAHVPAPIIVEKLVPVAAVPKPKPSPIEAKRTVTQTVTTKTTSVRETKPAAILVVKPVVDNSSLRSGQSADSQSNQSFQPGPKHLTTLMTRAEEDNKNLANKQIGFESASRRTEKTKYEDRAETGSDISVIIRSDKPPMKEVVDTTSNSSLRSSLSKDGIKKQTPAPVIKVQPTPPRPKVVTPPPPPRVVPPPPPPPRVVPPPPRVVTPPPRVVTPPPRVAPVVPIKAQPKQVAKRMIVKEETNVKTYTVDADQLKRGQGVMADSSIGSSIGSAVSSEIGSQSSKSSESLFEIKSTQSDHQPISGYGSDMLIPTSPVVSSGLKRDSGVKSVLSKNSKLSHTGSGI